MKQFHSFALMAWLLFWAALTQAESPYFSTATISTVGFGPYADMTACVSLTSEDLEGLRSPEGKPIPPDILARLSGSPGSLSTPSGWPFGRSKTNGVHPSSARDHTQRVYAFTVPEDYINPFDLVTAGRDPDHQVRIFKTGPRSKSIFEEVFSFEAPEWAQWMLVHFEPNPDRPSEPSSDVHTGAHLFLRAVSPFVSSTFEREPTLAPGEIPNEPRVTDPVVRWGVPQADYFSLIAPTRSDNGFWPHGERAYGERLVKSTYVLINTENDPAPNGLKWHVALGWENPFDLDGTLSIWFSDSDYRPPFAVSVFFSQYEKDQGVGFFDATPRTPNGDNPELTYGDALQWKLRKSLESAIEQLDSPGFLPYPVMFETFLAWPGLSGLAIGSQEVRIHHNRPAPGRLAGRLGGKTADFGVPHIVAERESGTTSCRVASGRWWARGSCAWDDSSRDGRFPRMSSHIGHIMLSALPFNHEGDWELNWENRQFYWMPVPGGHPRPMRNNLARLIHHELGHLIGFAEAQHSMGYQVTFDPPRRALDAPSREDLAADPKGLWWRRWEKHEHRGGMDDPFSLFWGGRVFLGPETARHKGHPFGDSNRPGIRLMDTSIGDNAHPGLGTSNPVTFWEKYGMVISDVMGSTTGPEWGPSLAVVRDLGWRPGEGALRDTRLPRQWFDTNRDGHGFDIRRIDRGDGTFVHFLHFYTYDQAGDPEWYLAISELEGARFFEGTLGFYTYKEGRVPPQQIDPARSGHIRIDFRPPFDHPACWDRRQQGLERPFQVGEFLFAVVDWELNGESGQWCVQPLAFGDQPAWPTDATGTWANSDLGDDGWGMSVVHKNFGAWPILVSILYYYDAEGNPTWAWGATGTDHRSPFRATEQMMDIEKYHFRGYCRTCAKQPLQPTPNGSMRIRFGSPDMLPNGSNLIESLRLEDFGPGGGRWDRDNIQIKLLSSPNPSIAR